MAIISSVLSLEALRFEKLTCEGHVLKIPAVLSMKLLCKCF